MKKEKEIQNFVETQLHVNNRREATPQHTSSTEQQQTTSIKGDPKKPASFWVPDQTPVSEMIFTEKPSKQVVCLATDELHSLSYCFLYIYIYYKITKL